MDFSKLPRLSRTDTPPNDAAPEPAAGQAYARPRNVVHYDRYMNEPPPGSSGVEVWFSVVIGLLMILLGWGYAKYALAKLTGAEHHTGVTWAAGPKAGLEVAYPELEGFVYYTESGMFYFGLALLVDALVRLVYRLRPGVGRLLLLGALLLSVAVVAYNLFVLVKVSQGGQLPILSFLAVAFGGYVAWSQSVLVRLPPPGPRAALPATRPDARAREVVAGTLGAEEKARCTHYRFAHHALRQAALENPQRCVGLLQGPGSGKFLRELWDAVRRDCDSSGQPAAEDGAEGLEADMTQVGPYTGAIVQMPPAKYKGEAQFVALVLRSYTRADGSVVERHPLLLYYTLERTGGGEGARAVLCEWQAGDHVKYADAPNPDASSFREAIQEKVNALQKREDGGE